MGEEFIGAGWAFPLRTDATGSIALVSNEREIEESIRLILATAPGERPMRPEFGCARPRLRVRSRRRVHRGRIAYAVRRAPCSDGSRGSTLNDVVVRFDAVEPGTLYIDIQYSVRGTNDPRNLVFPFYVIPPTRGGV